MEFLSLLWDQNRLLVWDGFGDVTVMPAVSGWPISSICSFHALCCLPWPVFRVQQLFQPSAGGR